MSSLATPRLAIMLVFSAFGALVGIWAGSIPQVTAQAGVGNSELGLAFAAATLAGVLSMGLGGILGKTCSNRALLLVFLPLSLLFTVGLMVSGSSRMFLAFVVLQAIALGFCDVFMNAEASAIEHDEKRPIFTAFHGALSLCIAAFAILSSFVTAAAGPLASCVPAAIVVAAAWVAVWKLVPGRRAAMVLAAAPIGALWRRFPLWLMGLAVGLSIAAESAAVLWSAKLIQEQSPDLARIYGMGVAFFGTCQALLRFVADRLRSRFGETNVLLVSFAAAAISFSILGLAPPLAVSALAFSTIGFGLAATSPCLFVLATQQSPANRAAGMAVVSLVAGVPRVLAPLLFGWVAAFGGMVAVFGLASLIPLAGMLIVFWLRAHGIRAPVAT